VSPLRGEKPQNWPLSKLNTGRFALRAMLPVITPSSSMDRNNRNVTHGTVVVHQSCHHSRHIRHRSGQLGCSGRRQHTETGCQGTLQSHIDNVRYV